MSSHIVADAARHNEKKEIEKCTVMMMQFVKLNKSAAEIL